MTAPSDPPPTSRADRRRWRWAISRQRRVNPAVDSWIAALARHEGTAQVPLPMLDELGRLLAHEGGLGHEGYEGQFPDEVNLERPIVVPVALLNAVYQELARRGLAGDAQPSSAPAADPVEALTSALAGGVVDIGWAGSEAARVLAELTRSGWQLVRAPGGPGTTKPG
jgi:hypothetical protein